MSFLFMVPCASNYNLEQSDQLFVAQKKLAALYSAEDCNFEYRLNVRRSYL
jgi:hypothetical protein